MKNTVRKIRLEGELGEKFGEIWNLNVQTPHEAIRAIECQTKGFRKHIIDNAEKGIGYEVIIGDQGIKQQEELLHPAPMRDDFTIVPMVQGAKSRGFGMFLMGAALFIASGGASALIQGIQGVGAGAFSYPTLGTAGSVGAVGVQGATLGQSMATAFGNLSSLQVFGAQIGGMMMLGGASMMLAPTIDGSAGNEEQSYLFDGAVNSVKQGTPVPILYGRMTVGGAVISASIKSNQETAGITGVGRRYVVGTGTNWQGSTGGGNNKWRDGPGQFSIE